ncbi:MAG TPA: GGDEF domain-containing protein [Longimicrobiales bacterium]
MRLHGSTSSSPNRHLRLVQSAAVPALIAAVLFFMSGGDLVIITLAFALLVWAFFATRRQSHTKAQKHEAQQTAQDTTDFIRAGIEWCLVMSGAKRVVLWFVDDGAGLARVVSATGGSWPNAHVLHGSPVTWVARERVSTRIAPPPEWSETLRVIGVPVVQAQATHALTFELSDDIDVNPQQFDGLGIYIGALLNVQQDHILLAQYQNRMEQLIAALRALPNTTDAVSLAQELLSAAVRMSNGQGAAVVEWTGDSGEVVATEGSGLHAGNRIENESLTALAARGRATLARRGAGMRGLRLLSERERFLPTPEAAAAIPLTIDASVIGVLTLWTSDPGGIAEETISALETIAPYAAVQLEHARELGKMRALAERDGLTGLANRRAFDTQLLVEWARWERHQRAFSLLLFDLDHFKRINDQHGHDAGDEVLRTVGRTLAALLRGRDFAARYGGEEFAVLLSETPAKTAVEIAERVRGHIELTQPVFGGKPIPVTISGGVVSSASQLSPQDMVRRADQLLYKAKSEGRNRVIADR